MANVLRRDVIVERDPMKALGSLLQLPALKKYHDSLATDHEKHDFKRHMRKYIDIWSPDCPFEVSTTNRYEITTHEAATTARRFIKSGETVKYLCGNLVAMTPEEESARELERRDFSIITSSRKKTNSLFLGPARFSNHDCNANAKLESRESGTMIVIAVRDIDVGDEITVNYGNNYFDEGNCSCLCASCESEGRGAWRRGRNVEQGKNVADTIDAGTESGSMTPGSRRSKRRRPYESPASRNEGSPRKRRCIGMGKTPTSADMPPTEKVFQTPVMKNANKAVEPRRTTFDPRDVAMRSMIENRSTAKGQSPRKLGYSNMRSGVKTGSSLSRASTMPVGPLPRKERPSKADAAPLARPYFKSTMLFEFMRNSRKTLDGPYTPLHQLPSPVRSRDASSSSSEATSSFGKHLDRTLTPITTPSAGTTPRQQQDSELSSLSPAASEAEVDSEAPDAVRQPPPRKRGRPRKYPRPATPEGKVNHSPPKTNIREAPAPHVASVRDRAQSTPDKHPIQTVELGAPDANSDDPSSPTNTHHRTPGDYTRTRALLGVNHSRWVDCRTCEICWVQANGYQTRKECPRCERHSKLYGYQWPKTDREKGDPERVMDHRTVHRFIPRDEEILERKKGKGLVRGATETGEGDTDDDVATKFESGGRWARGRV